MVKLKLQYLGHLIWRSDSLEKTLMLGQIEGRRRRGQQRIRWLFLGRKVRTKVDSLLKSKDISLPTKICLVKAMIFPIVMCVCESWIIKKAQHWKIDAFELWCWIRLLWVPWTARRSNQSILKEIVLNIHWKDWCWSWNCNTLATWCEELTH